MHHSSIHPVTYLSIISFINSIHCIHIHFHLHSYFLSYVTIPSILGNCYFSIERKKPFARLLDWAYINPEKDSLLSMDTLVNNE